jgi:ketosteroid isomerase-like protein
MSCRRHLLYCVLLVSSCADPSAGQQFDNKPEDQIVQVERDWLAADAKGDALRMRQLIADDFIGSSPDGSVLNKDDLIPENGTSGGFAGAVVGSTIVRVFGDTGVLMGVVRTSAKTDAKQIHVTLVCQKTTQGWQIIAAQLTRL